VGGEDADRARLRRELGDQRASAGLGHALVAQPGVRLPGDPWGTDCHTESLPTCQRISIAESIPVVADGSPHWREGLDRLLLEIIL